MSYAAIPTMYGGVQFRSRLEARWAAMFDLLGWSWEYEPIDLNGYIPDFFVDATAAWDGTQKRHLVEVKPVRLTDQLDDVFFKAERAGWTEDLVVLGREFQYYNTEWSDGGDLTIGTAGTSTYRRPFDLLLDRWDRDTRFLYTLGDKDSVGIPNPHAVSKAVGLWRESGNRVQWRKPSTLDVDGTLYNRAVAVELDEFEKRAKKLKMKQVFGKGVGYSKREGAAYVPRDGSWTPLRIALDNDFHQAQERWKSRK